MSGLDFRTIKGNNTNKDSSPLVKDEYGEPPNVDFSYIGVVGMFLYLGGHLLPNISHVFNCVARCIFSPKHSHELVLKIIGQYLKTTRNGGLLLNSSIERNIYCYLDADFSGMHWH